MVADTPGFTSLDINNISADKLQFCFPEFSPYENCRFTNCLHDSEPDCRVKEALAAGKINKLRYQYYISILTELKSNRRY
jgi:ribosome biogenesis GTPase